MFLLSILLDARSVPKMKYSKNLCFKLEFGGCFGGENTIGCFNRVYSVVIRLIGGFWGVFGVFHSFKLYVC